MVKESTDTGLGTFPSGKSVVPQSWYGPPGRLKQATAAPCSMWSWARSPSSLGSSGGIGICDGPEGGVGMAGDNLNVFYDSGGDHLEIVFDPKAGSYEKT